MKLLAVDTATEACSAALLIDGNIRQRYRIAPREHSHLILPMIDELMAEAALTPAQLDCLAFGRGPGAFMGIRIAAGVVQGIGFAHDLPVVPVSTLRALALNAMQQSGATQVLSAIDARMQEVYWAAWRRQDDTLSEILPESVCKPEAVALPADGKWLGAGSGWHSYAGVLQQRLGPLLERSLGECLPSAQAIAQLARPEFEQGKAVAADAAVPVYIRDNVAAKPKNR